MVSPACACERLTARSPIASRLRGGACRAAATRVCRDWARMVDGEWALRFKAGHAPPARSPCACAHAR